MKDVEYYLARGFERKMAEYFVAGRKRIVAVQPNNDFTLTITFDNGEKRLYDMVPHLEIGTVFEPLRNLAVFCRVYVDDAKHITWDVNPKIDLCPDCCYVDSTPLCQDDQVYPPKGNMDRWNSDMKFPSVEPLDCPECKRAQRIMRTTGTADGGCDVIGHCPWCLQDWQWHCDAQGRPYEMQRYFHG